nr:hypothetical protein [Candidatus Gracilibacteria bacterium]
MFKYLKFPLLGLFLLSFSGCLGPLIGMVCDLVPDSDHCYQAAAGQSGDESKCEKIKGEKFKDLGSNPPRDKCYLQIAENTGNYSACNKIKGGAMSYTIEECLLSTALKQNDAGGCKKLDAYPSEQETCRSQLCSLTAVKAQDEEIERIREELKNDKDNADLKKQLEKLKAEKEERYAQMPESEKGEYFKEKREEIMGDIEDSDVQSEISKAYVSFRAKNPDLSMDQLLDRMKEIKNEQLAIKRADEEANQLMDTIKDQLNSFAEEKQNEVLDSVKEKGMDWINKNGGENLKWSLKNLEWAKEKYEKGSEQYEALNSKYEKLKKAYDEIKQTYQRIDEFNKM